MNGDEALVHDTKLWLSPDPRMCLEDIDSFNWTMAIPDAEDVYATHGKIEVFFPEGLPAATNPEEVPMEAPLVSTTVSSEETLTEASTTKRTVLSRTWSAQEMQALAEYKMTAVGQKGWKDCKESRECCPGKKCYTLGTGVCLHGRSGDAVGAMWNKKC